jgi:hypothetical protein
MHPPGLRISRQPPAYKKVGVFQYWFPIEAKIGDTKAIGPVIGTMPAPVGTDPKFLTCALS